MDKIPAFLQAFKHVISMFTTAQSGIWVWLLVPSHLDFWLSFEGCQNIFGLFVIHILSKLEKIFEWKNYNI